MKDGLNKWEIFGGYDMYVVLHVRYGIIYLCMYVCKRKVSSVVKGDVSGGGKERVFFLFKINNEF